VFSDPPCGERYIADTRRRTVAPPTISVRRSSLCLPLVAFSRSKDTLFGLCTLLLRRLQRNGAKGFLRATKGVLGAIGVRGGGAAVDNRSRVGGIRDVHAGAALAVSKRL
jgi:hypothetical protein